MSDFHFLRPWWLAACAPLAFLAWRLWTTADQTRRWQDIVAPHLLPYLLVGDEHRGRRWPMLLLLTSWMLGVVALSGPTWRREPAPFADDQAALVIVFKVTPSMQTEDIQPTRLARGVQKIHDLLQLRPGAKTALVVYSGSAHQVMPLTTDAGIIDSFAGELDPSVMPKEGDAAGAALRLADQIVQQSQQRGWILWIGDAAAPALTKELEEYRNQNRTPVTLLAAAAEGTERKSLVAAAAKLNAPVISLTADDADVQRLAKNTHFSVAAAEVGERWQDAGYWLVPLIACACLFWFRPGWVVNVEGPT